MENNRIFKGRNAVFAILSICLLQCHSTKKLEKNAPPQNVVFILVDDLGWKDLGVYGSTFYETPNIDKLAAQGTLFNNAYTPNPVCSPTRASILTGKYPSRVGITDWIPGNDPKDRKLLGPKDLHQLPHEEVTLAEALKQQGYATFFAGKWHLGDTGFFPEDQGFDINKGGHHMGQPPAGYYTPYNNPKLTDGPEGEYLTDRLTTESINFLTDNKNNPFLLYLSYYTVHTPIQANKACVEKFIKKRESLPQNSLSQSIKEPSFHTRISQDDADYASMVYALDQNIGRLMRALDSLGLSDNTLIVFTSDNGGLSTFSNNHKRIAPTSVRPLRAGKGWLYEGGIRVPLIIKTPGQTIKSSDVPVVSMDLYPTILDLLDLPFLPNQHQDGRTVVPILKGKKQQIHQSLLFHYPHYHGSGMTPGTAVRVGDWKLIYFYEEDKYELYNLKEDIGEQKDLSREYPEKLEMLKKELKKLLQTTNAQPPVMNPDY